MLTRLSLLSFLSALFIGSLALVIPTPNSEAQSPVNFENHYEIVATTTQIADLVKNVVGTKAHVTSLLGPETDPHLYRLTRTDSAKLVKADVIFYNGLMLEGRMESIINKLEKAHRPVFAIADLLNPSFFIPAEDPILNPYDPHIWNNTALWKEAATQVANTLCKIDIKNCQFFQDNASHYKKKITLLDHYIHETIDTIPKTKRILITAHDAFNYLGQAYGLDVIGIQGISTDSEAGLYHINKVIDLIIKKDIQSIFIETSISDRNIKALIEGTASRGHKLVIGGYLYSDAMGKAGSYHGTYIGMMDHNITTIVEALGGHTPEKGFQSSVHYAKMNMQK